MILFLIEIYLVGLAIAVHFKEKISDFFLSFLAILLGLFAYFVSAIFIISIQSALTAQALALIMGVEFVLLVLAKVVLSRKTGFHLDLADLWYLAAGTFFVLGSMIFLRVGITFATPDSLYLIVMSKGLVESGFTNWYFASPLHWGLFVPIVQAIGPLFGYDYSWFIQPIISVTFLILVGYTIFVASREISKNKIVPYVLSLLGVGILVSSNLYWIALFYIHTNLDTGLSLYLVVISLYFAVRQKNDAWLGIAAIFLIILGLTRSENVILAAIVIVLTISAFDISHRKLLWTFLPYLVIQIVWNMAIIQINPIVFSNLMSVSQLRLVTIALVFLAFFVILSGQAWFKRFISPLLNKLVVIGVGVLLVVVFALKPEKIFLDTWDNLQTMFGTGKWLATFWGIVPLLFLVRVKDRTPTNHFFNILFFTFFSMIIILGYVIGGYHSQWFVSANRMFIHILPLMIFYLSIKISTNYSCSDSERQMK